MRVALDVDGVLADFVGASLAWIRSQLGIHLKYEDITIWDFLALIPEELRPRLADAWNAEHFCAMIPIVRDTVFDTGERRRVEDAVKAIQKNHVVRCVTADMKTSLHWKRERSAWLKNIFGFAYDDIIYSHAKHEEHEAFDILIDDKPANVRDWMLKTGKPAILIDQPWNRDSHLPYRAQDLWDAYYLLDKLTPKNLP